MLSFQPFAFVFDESLLASLSGVFPPLSEVYFFFFFT